MHKYKLVLEYDGANYRGWQAQKNAKSIQETLIAAAQKFLGEPVEIQGAGRTDAGVHALAQAAHLECSRQVEPVALCAGINENLPETINLLSVENAAPRFHARHHAVSRSYLYLISKRRSVLGRRYAWWIPDRLDLEKMRRVLGIFRGFHDFVSFTDKRMEKGSSTEVNVEGLWLQEFGDLIAIRIVGSHFLWKMVRRIVGVTAEAGRGGITAGDAEKMLLAFSEVPKKHTAPPHGLFLEKVLYEGDTLPGIKPPIALL
jgi:tRNA pseudouridine38-40 synthase